MLSPQESRALEYAENIIENDDTIRETAKIFSTSKTTVWSYLHKYLPRSFPKVYKELRKTLAKHKSSYFK